MSQFHMTVITPDRELGRTAPQAGAPQGCDIIFRPEALSAATQVRSYLEKVQVIRDIAECARAAGVGASLLARIRRVADELMMNALYHGPTHAEDGPRDLARRAELDPIAVHFGCSNEIFGVYVRDDFGTLGPGRALQYLGRAAQQKLEIEEKRSGAGLGLAMVLKSCSQLTLRLRPNMSTEALAVFDMHHSTSRVIKKAVRSHAPQR